MKIIIDRKIYDTEKSKLIFTVERDINSNFDFIVEKLYKTPKWAFFIHWEWWARTPYWVSENGNLSDWKRSWLVDVSEVLMWIEEHQNYFKNSDIDYIMGELADRVENW